MQLRQVESCTHSTQWFGHDGVNDSTHLYITRRASSIITHIHHYTCLMSPFVEVVGEEPINISRWIFLCKLSFNRVLQVPAYSNVKVSSTDSFVWIEIWRAISIMEKMLSHAWCINNVHHLCKNGVIFWSNKIIQRSLGVLFMIVCKLCMHVT